MWFANGNDSDIICTVFQDYLSMINAGAFMELDDLIQEYGQDMIEKDKDKDFLSAGKYNDKLYGIPTIPAGPGNGGALYMRKDVYDQLDTSSMMIWTACWDRSQRNARTTLRWAFPETAQNPISSM